MNFTHRWTSAASIFWIDCSFQLARIYLDEYRIAVAHPIDVEHELDMYNESYLNSFSGNCGRGACWIEEKNHERQDLVDGWCMFWMCQCLFCWCCCCWWCVCVKIAHIHPFNQTYSQTDRQPDTHTHTNHNFNHTNTSTHLHSLHYTRTHTHSPFTHSDSFAHTIIRTANWLNQNMRPQKKGTFETHIAYIRTRTHKSNRIIRSVRRQVYLK